MYTLTPVLYRAPAAFLGFCRAVVHCGQTIIDGFKVLANITAGTPAQVQAVVSDYNAITRTIVWLKVRQPTPHGHA